jgi:hypothetical protein
MAVGGADRQDGESCQRESREAVPGVPAAQFVLVEADPALRRLESFIDGPADPGDAHDRGETDRLPTPAAVEGQLTGGVVPTDQDAVPAAVVGVGVGGDLVEPDPVVGAGAFGAGPG